MVTVPMLTAPATPWGSPSANQASALRKLAKIVKAFEDEQDLSKGLALVDELVDLAEKNEGSWEVCLWTAYIHTQAGRWVKQEESDADGSSWLDEAQRFLDKAESVRPPESKQVAASLHALRSLIASFRTWLPSDQVTRETYESLMAISRNELQQALKIDPENPAALVMVATNMIGDAMGSMDRVGLIAGLAVLDKTRDALKKAGSKKTSTAFWNAQWVESWTDRARGALKS